MHSTIQGGYINAHQLHQVGPLNFQDPPTRAENMSSLFLLFLLHITIAAAAQLRPDHYLPTCPNAESIVRNVMKKALIREPRSVASVMRLQFNDCFVNVTYKTSFLTLYIHVSYLLISFFCFPFKDVNIFLHILTCEIQIDMYANN